MISTPSTFQPSTSHSQDVEQCVPAHNHVSLPCPSFSVKKKIGEILSRRSTSHDRALTISPTDRRFFVAGDRQLLTFRLTLCSCVRRHPDHLTPTDGSGLTPSLPSTTPISPPRRLADVARREVKEAQPPSLAGSQHQKSAHQNVEVSAVRRQTTGRLATARH